jgi:hypothetical protein
VFFLGAGGCFDLPLLRFASRCGCEVQLNPIAFVFRTCSNPGRFSTLVGAVFHLLFPVSPIGERTGVFPIRPKCSFLWCGAGSAGAD